MSGKNALVVDDDTMNRELLHRMLIRLGWQVSEAQDGRSAIAACGDNRYDLILMDFFMPELDGVSTARAIRDIYNRGGYTTRLLAVTGSDYGEEERIVFDGFLPKPFVMDELAQAIALIQTAFRV